MPDLLSAVEQFEPLAATAVCRHAFVGRIPGVEVNYDKSELLRRLDSAHLSVRRELGLAQYSFATAQQVHGDLIVVIDQPLDGDRCFDGADGLITNQVDLCLGIYVADCCAVYLVDSVRRVIGLVHSGRKGTELGIVTCALAAMGEHFGSEPKNVVAQLSPCIRPPHYEVNFAAEIVAQCRRAGVVQITDSGTCTACDLEHYYSYRAEKGRTGRMVALLALV
ncbi:MAG TPA: polyphenol oxidase family protein [Chthoniobacterales bacterium]|nr:polyphenol oxidase family protein [Chthoniobacterales bacterium]